MKLYIDTHEREKIVIWIDNGIFETDAKDGSSQKLLSFIDEVLKKEGKTVKNVGEIEVNTGPGSFTGIRVGVAVANTMAYALNVPVNKKKMEVEIKY